MSMVYSKKSSMKMKLTRSASNIRKDDCIFPFFLLYCFYSIKTENPMSKPLGTKQIYIISGIAVSVIIILFILAAFFMLDNALRKDPDPLPNDNTKTYNVIFRNMDNSEISVKTYHEGDTLVVPPDPTFRSDEQYTYKFLSWDKELSMTVTEDAIYTAIYESTLRYYGVTFYNYDGKVLFADEHVTYGSSVSYTGKSPSRPSDEKNDYTFLGWDTDVSFITGDTEVHALFNATPRRYSIRFLNEDGTLYEQIFATYEEDVRGSVPDPVKEPEGNITFLFIGWDADLSCIVGDMTVSPIFEAQTTCMITFRDTDGTLISEEEYEIDSPVTPPVMPATKNGLYFSGWNKPIALATEDTVYTAVYSSSPVNFTLTVKYVFDDGTAAAADYVSSLPYGTAYYVPSPSVDHFEPDRIVVSGHIYGDITLTVTYAPSGTIPMVDGIYEIGTKDQLVFLSKSPDLWTENFKLINNISLSGIDWSGLGNRLKPFSGTFDGNGYTVSNVKVSSAESDYMQISVGFFNSLSGTATNLKLDVEFNFVTTVNQLLIGGIAGELTGKIENCSVTVKCNITGNYVQFGLITGNARQAEVVNASAVCNGATVRFATSLRAGGFAGYARSCTFTGCSASGNVSASIGDVSLFGAMDWIGDMANMDEIALHDKNSCTVTYTE